MSKLRSIAHVARIVAAGIAAGFGSLASAGEALAGDAPTWWHEVTLASLIVAAVAHAVVVGIDAAVPPKEG